MLKYNTQSLIDTRMFPCSVGLFDLTVGLASLHTLILYMTVSSRKTETEAVR
jgi:hypothetical protein